MENGGSGKCVFESGGECIGRLRAEEVASEVKELDRRLSDFQQSVSNTNIRFGERLGKLESKNEVQDEQVRHIKESLMEIRSEIRESQKEQKNSIAEMRAENKESMSEIKRNYKEILDAVTPMKHEIEDVEDLKREVAEIKAKPGKTFESIKEKGLGYFVALIVGLLVAALGLSKYL